MGSQQSTSKDNRVDQGWTKRWFGWLSYNGSPPNDREPSSVIATASTACYSRPKIHSTTMVRQKRNRSQTERFKPIDWNSPRKRQSVPKRKTISRKFVLQVKPTTLSSEMKNDNSIHHIGTPTLAKYRTMITTQTRQKSEEKVTMKAAATMKSLSPRKRTRTEHLVRATATQQDTNVGNSDQNVKDTRQSHEHHLDTTDVVISPPNLNEKSSNRSFEGKAVDTLILEVELGPSLPLGKRSKGENASSQKQYNNLNASPDKKKHVGKDDRLAAKPKRPSPIRPRTSGAVHTKTSKPPSINEILSTRNRKRLWQEVNDQLERPSKRGKTRGTVQLKRVVSPKPKSPISHDLLLSSNPELQANTTRGIMCDKPL